MKNLLEKYRITDTTPVNINPTKWFWGYTILHLIFWTLAPTLFRATIPFDSAEGYAWGNQFQWGYDKHPFVAPWMTALFANYGGGVGFANYFASQICVVIAFVCIWQLAKKMMSPLYALVAIFIMSGLDFYTLASNKIDPDILTLATWALAILCFYNACIKGNTLNWILAGVTAGLAMMSKYTTLLLLITMLGFLIYNEEQRQQFKKPALYIGMLAFILVILPNTIWLFHHDFISITYAMNRGGRDAFHHYPLLNHIAHPIFFIFNEVIRCLLVILVAYPLFFCLRDKSIKNQFDKQFLLTFFISPFILAIIISIFLGTDIHAGWAFPFFTLAGIVLTFFLRPKLNKKAFKYLMIFVIVISAGLLVGRYTAMHLSAYATHKADKSAYPMRNVAAYVSKEWENEYHKPLKYVAGSRYLTAFITAYAPSHPTPYYSWSHIHSAWINEDALRKTGAMFVWWADGQKKPELPAAILKRFPTVKDLKIVRFKMLSGAKVPPLAIGMAILPPAN